jgi:T5SS/PEP-CTERM-associated repeat protein
MFLENGGSLSGTNLLVGGWDSAIGTAIINGSGTTVNLTGSVGVAASNNAQGAMFVSAGASVTALNTMVGNAVGATGEFTLTGPGSSLTLPTGQFLVGNNITASTATFSSGATASAVNFQLNAGSTINLNAATLNAASISLNGGAFNFNAGAVNFTGGWTADFPQVTGILGSAASLGSGHTIQVATTLALQSPLTLNGGTLRAGTITGMSNLVLNTGTFELTNSSLGVSPNLTVGPNLSLRVSGPSSSLDIPNGGTLFVPGGNVSATTTNISGRLQLASPVAELRSTTNVNSGGVIQGTGQVKGFLLVNPGGTVRALAGDYLVFREGPATVQGTVDLLGGTVEWRGPVTFGGSGMISGRGSINAASATPASPGAITNNGTFQFSGGFSDVRGSLVGNGGSKIIVTGGATATFYNNVSLAAGSNFQVSANSAAVFFGNVSGTNNFTGSGTKYFEAGTSPIGPVQTPGSTVVEAPASVTASYFREDSLTVNGHAIISTGGGTSHLNELNIEGSTDNWSGKLDLKNNSLVLEGGNLSVITNQIKNGLLSGSGIISSAPATPFRLGAISNNNGAGSSIYSSFQGIGGLDGDEVLVRYTVIGDLNLDGTVSISDFIDLAAHFNTASGATWQIGDVNYDGAVTIADFIDLASNFNQSVAGPALPISGDEAAMLSDFAASIGANSVPEPTMLSLSLLALLGSRRRR